LFSEKINRVDKPLANLTSRRKEMIQMNKIKDEKVDIATNINEIQMILREYMETYIKTNWNT
jgi:hypothetical protein